MFQLEIQHLHAGGDDNSSYSFMLGLCTHVKLCFSLAPSENTYIRLGNIDAYVLFPEET